MNACPDYEKLLPPGSIFMDALGEWDRNDEVCRKAYEKYGKRLHRVSADGFVGLGQRNPVGVTKVCEWPDGDIGFVWNDELEIRDHV